MSEQQAAGVGGEPAGPISDDQALGLISTMLGGGDDGAAEAGDAPEPPEDAAGAGAAEDDLPPEGDAEAEGDGEALDAGADAGEAEAEPEGEGEGEGEPEPQDAAQAEDDREPKEGEDRKFKVKVQGEEIEVSLDELIQGYQRTADYTRKTQALAEQRRQFEAERAQLMDMAQRLNEVAPLIAAVDQPEPDWAELAKQLPPEQYQQARAAWEKEQRYKQQALALWQDIQARQQMERLENEIRALVQSRPEFKDPTKLQELRGQIVNVAGEYGFTPEEIDGIVDHRMVLALADLAKFRQAERTRRQLEDRASGRAKPKAAMKPGPRRSAGPQDGERRRRELLKRAQEGDEAAAISLIADAL